ncbi:hypothetical protein P692DRAFT_201692726, partial [Suillus brevipes Sb2]
PHHLSSSIFYPGMQLAESKDVILQPLSLLVWFSGAVPCHLAHPNIPIEISVSLKDEYKSFTVPVCMSCDWEMICKDSLFDSSCLVMIRHAFQSCSADNNMSFSFLPLPPTFDHMDSDNWAELLDNIQSWLIESVDPSTPEWAWGWEVFWYVFIATNPDFPGGKWSFWDPSIFLEGQFIEEWV